MRKRPERELRPGGGDDALRSRLEALEARRRLRPGAETTDEFLESARLHMQMHEPAPWRVYERNRRAEALANALVKRRRGKRWYHGETVGRVICEDASRRDFVAELERAERRERREEGR